MKKILALLILLLSLSLVLCSCGSSGSSRDEWWAPVAEWWESVGEWFEGVMAAIIPPAVKPTYKVMLSVPEGVTVQGDNPITVTEGEDAEFRLSFASDCMYASVTHGRYMVGTRKVVISDVTKNINATLAVNRYDFDTSKTFMYMFNDTGKETSSVSDGMRVNAGIVISLSANDKSRRFVGWSVGASFVNGGRLISDERDYDMVLSPDLANASGVVYLYPNYTDTNLLYYNPNGGVINTGTANVTNSLYYTASTTTVQSETVLGVRMLETYFSKLESYSSFYDDGTFTRDGYVLVEYNTKPDGTGDSYSLGSKVYFSPDEEYPTLYCIWAEDTPHDSFVYKDITISRPKGISAASAPNWVQNGIIITEYKGNEETIVIPEKIGDKHVIAIAANAFKNKDVKTLVLNRRIIKVENSAFIGCSSLETVYFPDGMYQMYNEAFDADTYKNFKHLYVNATMPPRYIAGLDGSHAVAMSRLLAAEDENRIIVIGGSSAYEGLSSEYLESLLDNDYRVVNFGTTRTTHCTMYLEAMSSLAHEGDVVVYAPENSAYQLGERELYWKTLRDLEGMINIYRYVDISNYTNVFTAFTSFNKGETGRNGRYSRTPQRYESIVEAITPDPNPDKSPTAVTDFYGDHDRADRKSYVNFDIYNPDVYYHTLCKRMKSRLDTNSSDMEQEKLNKLDFMNENNTVWCSMDDPYYLDVMNRIITSAKSSGAKVYFGFCPTDGEALVPEAQNLEWIRAYDKLIEDIYVFDGSVGKCENYVYSRIYFYDNAFHLNDYGRTYRTYQFYTDLAQILGITDLYGITELGTGYNGCLFESGTTGKPRMTPIFLAE